MDLLSIYDNFVIKMENTQAVAALRKELAEIEARIAFLEKPVSNTMTEKDFRQRVVDMYDTKEWKEFVSKPYGVVSNIVDILDECYVPFVDCIKEDFPDKDYKSIIGKSNSLKWQEFMLAVIKDLINPSNMDDEFDDTANGCDEVAWDAGLAVIQKLAN